MCWRIDRFDVVANPLLVLLATVTLVGAHLWSILYIGDDFWNIGQWPMVTNISYLISTIDVAIDDERALYISNFEIIWNHVQHKFIKKS